jgi:hypothetical protein
MEEAVSQTASNLVPLLLVLAVVFGGLIVAALVLRTRIRGETGPQPVKRRAASTRIANGDVVSVLGRSFMVETVDQTQALGQASVWCSLRDDEGPCRTTLAADRALAVHFPGCEDPPEGEAYPETIERDDGHFERLAAPEQLGQGLRLAVYRGRDGRWLALEERAGQTTLWRGKQIPAEGVVVLEED